MKLICTVVGGERYVFTFQVVCLAVCPFDVRCLLTPVSCDTISLHFVEGFE